MNNFFFFFNIKGQCDGSDDCSKGEDEANCHESQYINNVFIPENNTYISYLNYSSKSDLENLSKNLLSNQQQQPSQVSTSMPIMAGAAPQSSTTTNNDAQNKLNGKQNLMLKTPTNPISTFLLSQNQNVPKSKQSPDRQ